ncbi:threonine synthase-like 2 isoform X4 [Haliaeetus albicilla]|uniref:threonine synthase-like 2 isoform X4 n=1 Tax=Haliaeetus albicilla TaxID=8969 RepID=UPI0037E946D6
MEYVSTRGGAGAVDFEGALFSGYAPDGGLFMPQRIPSLDWDTLRRWSRLPYRELVKELCSLFITAELVPPSTLNDLIDRAFSRFRHKDVVHLSRLKDGLNVLELWHGVTYAFKDLSLSCTGQFLQYFLEKKKQHVTILCAPSLDTTPLPMVEIVVPTGGGGNITAGCIAQKMGLPIQLVAVVNSNDIIHRTVQHGDFSLSESVKATLASAMDIQEPYNMERILWLLLGSDSRLTKMLMERFSVSKSLKLPEDLHRKLSETLRSCSASDEDIVRAMQRCWEENRYLLCPHSAVAAHYHYSQPNSVPRCCLAPASAAKFQDALLRAGLVPQLPPEITALRAMETRSTPLERGQDWAQALREQIEAMARRWAIAGQGVTQT